MNRINFKAVILVSFFTLLLSINIKAQNGSLPINDSEKEQVVDSVAHFMKAYYVFPDIGVQIAEVITINFKDGIYKSSKTYNEFADQLNKDLLSVNNDKHIGMSYSPDEIKMIKEAERNKDKSYEEHELEREKFINFGFEEIKILSGNIGYLKFNRFVNASIGGNTAVAAMNFLANTNAIIVDLTENGGGSPSMIQLISSYFFEEPKHLNSFYIRKGNQTKQFWTQSLVQGPKMINTDLYILTSKRTFSAAEEFTYNFKNMNRATIIGETTGGGAHPVTGHIINDNFMISIPYGKAVNPITNTNWEGTGITPHIEVSAEKALNTAWLSALQKLKEKEENDQLKAQYIWAIEGLEAKINPVKLDIKVLESYVGIYGPRTIFIENGELFYQRENRPKFKMLPINDTYFYFEEMDYFRLKIIKEKAKVIALEGRYDNGYTDRSDKSN